MEKCINVLLTVFDRYKDVEKFKDSVTDNTNKLKAYNEARKYHFISDLVGGRKKYKENLAIIRDLELQLASLMEEADKGHTEEEIALNKQKAALTNEKLSIEKEIHAREMKLQLVSMNLEYGLYPTEADMSALQEYFPGVNLRKLYEVERYHQKLAKILDAQFAEEKAAIEKEIEDLKFVLELDGNNGQVKELEFVWNISREFLDRHSALKGEIDALKTQNEAFLKQNELQGAKFMIWRCYLRQIFQHLRTIRCCLRIWARMRWTALCRYMQAPTSRFLYHTISRTTVALPRKRFLKTTVS